MWPQTIWTRPKPHGTMVFAMGTARSFELIDVDDYLQGEFESEIRHEYVAGTVYAMCSDPTQKFEFPVAVVRGSTTRT